MKVTITKVKYFDGIYGPPSSFCHISKETFYYSVMLSKENGQEPWYQKEVWGEADLVPGLVTNMRELPSKQLPMPCRFSSPWRWKLLGDSSTWAATAGPPVPTPITLRN